MPENSLDDLDHKILRLIVGNARISFLEVARICNVSVGAVHQRVQKMTNNGIITGSEFTINLSRIGYGSCVYLGLCIDKEKDIDSVVDEISNIPETVECHYTSGHCDLFVKIYAQNNDHLLDIIKKKLYPLGVIRTESIVSYKEVFRRQVPFLIDVEVNNDSNLGAELAL